MNGSASKMASSVEAILLAAALFSANAAWCQSDTPSAAFEELTDTKKIWFEAIPEFKAVPISKIGVWDAVVLGAQMALARDLVWPSYAYEIFPDSDVQGHACKLLEQKQFDQDAAFLTSWDKLGARNSSGNIKGYKLEPSRVCGSGNIRESDNVRPSYAYEIFPDSDVQGHACQLLEQEQFGQDATFLTSWDKLGAQNSSGNTEGYELEPSRVCGSDLSASSEEGINYYLVTKSPVPSLELNTVIWPEDAEEESIYNYFSSLDEDINYYLVTKSPVPSLEPTSRVWFDERNYFRSISNSFWLRRPSPPLPSR